MNVVPRSTNPEVVGSIPTEVKRFFLCLVWSLIPFTRANAQWVIHRNKHFNLHFIVNSLFHHLEVTLH